MAVEHQPQLDLNLVSSNHLREWMLRRGAEAERIQICHTNIDAERWVPDPTLRSTIRRELGVMDDRPVILYSARLCEQKQPRVFAQTMLKLHQHGVSFVAWVAGSGPEFDWLRHFINLRGLASQVSLLGAVPPDRIRQLLAATDVFFLPSQWEGISLALFEAMAAGVPVVAADVGGQRELVTPECGILVPRGSEESEASQYAAVLSELLNDSRRGRALGAAGRQRVQAHFSLNQLGDRLEACLGQALAFQHSQPRPTPDLALGRMCAAHAVEYMRLSNLADQLWAERHGLQPTAPSHNWRRALYQRLYRWHEPYYRWYSKLGWAWLTPLREVVKRVLLRQASQV